MPTNKSIRTAFKDVYGDSPNFMTPDVYSYGYSLANPDLFFEISTGLFGFAADHIVGVTVLEMPEHDKRHDLNRCFSGYNKGNLISKAREYAEDLS